MLADHLNQLPRLVGWNQAVPILEVQPDRLANFCECPVRPFAAMVDEAQQFGRFAGFSESNLRWVSGYRVEQLAL